MPLDDLNRRKQRLKKRGTLFFLLLLAFLLFLSVGILMQPSTSFTVKYISNTVVIYAIIYINILLLIAFLLMLFRNITKLIQERGRKIPGSKFSTRLILIFTMLTLVPTLFLFIIASDIISTNVDQWFSQPVEVINNNSSKLIREMIKKEISDIESFARQLSNIIYEENLLESKDELYKRSNELINRFRIDLLHFFFITGKQIEPLYADKANQELAITFPSDQIDRALRGEQFAYHNIYDGRLIVSAGYPLYLTREENSKPVGVVVASTIIPEKISALVQQSQRFYSDYLETKRQKVNIKTSNIMLLSMITLILLFSASWYGLRLAREITNPIKGLVEGTNQISAGNLNYRVNMKASDELQTLVDSFNNMSEELQISKQRYEESNLRLQQSHQALEEQFHYIETVLRYSPAGIISIDTEGKVSTINEAASTMLALDADAVIGINYITLFRSTVLSEIKNIFSSINRKKQKTISRIIEIRPEQDLKKISVTCSPLRDWQDNYLGAVMVLEDLTELSRAQKLAAWREVARRIAHEIKNPLTPIQLSAQRLKKKLSSRRSAADAERSLIKESTETILEEVGTLKRLVDEFSLFARMPELNLMKYQLNRVVKNAYAAYDELQNGIEINLRLGKIPKILMDPEQMKRAIRNLIDNAIESMEEAGPGTISIATKADSDNGIELIISDQGKGIKEEERDKIFVPYFSSKKKGTGLGLAIVSKIIADHGGSISLTKNKPKGTIVTIHLPGGD